MPENRLPTICGLFCDQCTHLGKECSGCESCGGTPFWTKFLNVEACPLYACCVKTKFLAHCGLCPDFPCSKFMEMELSDPSLSREEAEVSALKRRNELIWRKSGGG